MRLPVAEIGEGLEAHGLALHVVEAETLVVADLHIGLEEALHERGVHLPRSQYREIRSMVETALAQARPRKVVLLGDVKHEFGSATRQEWSEVLDFIALLRDSAEEVVVVRGNHDNFLIPILRKEGVELYDPYYVDRGFLYVHGHRPLPPKAYGENFHTLVMGHEHPAIGLRDELGVKVKVKCFLVGRHKGVRYVVLPPFSPLMTGTEVNLAREPWSPVLRGVELDGFDVYAVDLEAGVLHFGKLGLLRLFTTL